MLTLITRFAMLVACCIPLNVAHASFTSNLGVTTSLLEPSGWSVGDAGSTHQIWNAKTQTAGNTPDQAYNTAGATLTAPVHSAISPGFVAGSGNYYSFAGNFAATADISNHATVGGTLGSHVIIQIGTTVQDGVDPETEEYHEYVGNHTELVADHGFGVFWETLQLVTPAGAALVGGTNAELLHASEVNFQSNVLTSFGFVDYQETIYEFWLPNYTEDFRVEWEEIIHSSIDTLRVDTMIATAAANGGTPFALTGFSGPEPTPGDFNGDLLVNGSDYAYWRENGALPAEFQEWINHYGTNYAPSVPTTPAPEPSSLGLILMLGLSASFCGWVEWFIRPRRDRR